MPRGNQVIRLSKSCVGAVETNAVSAVLSKEFLGMGPKVKEFESLLENFFGRPALCVSNGTAALQLALEACGIGHGDEVLVQSMTYVASYQAISATGATPVSCDIEEVDGTVNITDCQKRITERTKAIMPVHYGGGVGKLDLIHQFAKSNGLRIIEDAAHAFGSSYKGKRVGSFGDIACFSFDGIKNITSGEGGCIVTSDKEVLEKVSDSRLLGVKKDSQLRYEGKKSWLFQVDEQGWRYHMSDIMAAIGIAQLGRFEAFASKRRELASLYEEILNPIEKVVCIPHDYSQVVPHIFPIRIKSPSNRQQIQNKLHDEGIQTGIHYQPNHWLNLYKSTQSNPLPVTDKFFSQQISLPLHPELCKSDIKFICDKLLQIIAYK